MSATKVGVVGVGAMGRNHARVYSEMPNVELVGVADMFASNASQAARRYGGADYTDYRKMLDEQHPQAVSVAVPTGDHLEVALEVAQRGIHLLIEKPIAFDVAEARQIIQICADCGVVLAVGHVERFNPAVIELKQRLLQGELGRIFQVDARRQSPFPARVRDVGVVVDLAVHDLDLMRYVTDAEFTRVFAETQRQIHSTHEDLLTALFRLSNGAVGTLSVNWLTPAKVREMRVLGERGMFHVDYITQDLYFYENGTTAGEWDALRQLRGMSEGRMIRHVVNKREPLRAELESFLRAVNGAPVAVSGEDGLKAVMLAQAIITSSVKEQVVKL
ncbi:MAG: Gfo/Idh/MocA family oxidoreductase [Anaerolineae bacterium]|nr:Gfo/Idh/MocA family oxidoreductase [Anaerolineae bacterium]